MAQIQRVQNYRSYPPVSIQLIQFNYLHRSPSTVSSALFCRYTVTSSYECAIENLEKALKYSPTHENAKIYLAHTLQLEAKRSAAVAAAFRAFTHSFRELSMAFEQTLTLEALSSVKSPPIAIGHRLVVRCAL